MFRLSRIDGRRRGVALVIVLTFLVLITVMIVAFFSSVTTELGSAKSYASGVSARQLADSAVSLVMGTIGTATSTGGSNAWASQPGMIRTYDSNGNPLTYYKLYSSDNMVLSSTDIVTNDGSYGEPFNFTHDLRTPADSATQLTQWADEAAIFTDLNAPIVSGTAELYPIVDPAALPTVSGTIVEGFSALEASDPGSPVASGSNANRLPMPVKWIYMLKNGALTAPDGYSNGGNTATWSNKIAAALTPTATNPIVGRIAFWTDDETCKVNINTASEGTFWGSPVTSSQEDVQIMAGRIPVQNEWQRTPGHPATTCLSTVLGSITSLHRNYPLPPGTPANNNNYSPFSLYYLLAPRLSDAGGSTRAGTVAGTAPIVLDSDRLYASVDELLFSPLSSAGLRELNPPPPGNPSGIITPDVVEQSKFFLTASSRAPEVNMFNRPRVCLWPLQVSPDPVSRLLTRNAQDNLIAFCSTTGTGNKAQPYYFQRMSVTGAINAGSPTGGMPASGAGSSQHPTLDFNPAAVAANSLGAAAQAAVTRNNQLFTYLQNLTGGSTSQTSGIPGFSSGTFLTKYPSPNSTFYPSDRDQILTEMVDYIRCYVNSYSQVLNQPYNYLPPNLKPYYGSGQSMPIEISSASSSSSNGAGGIAVTGTTKGFGSYLTVTGAALDFVKTSPATSTSGSMQAGLLLEFYNPAQGQPALNPYTRIEISGLDSLTYNGTPFGFPSQFNARLMNSAYLGKDGGGGAGSFVGLSGLTEYGDGGPSYLDPPRQAGTANDLVNFPYCSNNIRTPAGSSWVLGGGTNITIRIYSGFDPAGATAGRQLDQQWLVQSIHMNFLPNNAPLTLPLPNSNPPGLFSSRFANDGNGSALVKPGDVLRGLMVSATNAAGGDLRMMAALPDVSTTFFTTPPGYSSSSSGTAYSLRTTTSLTGNATYLTNSFPNGGTQLVPGVNYSAIVEPTAAHGLAGASLTTPNGTKAPGDWDNGYGAYEDGAYINKADVMNTASVVSGTSDYYYISSYAYDTGLTYSPNRQISSAVSFGSLPTGVIATEAAVANNKLNGKPWQTLLFCPNPAAGGFNNGHPNHPGFGTTAQNSFYNPAGALNMPPYTTPPDHLMLDLFTMPIVQPYPISEPFSTAGKINLNYQLAPFSYITRSTGIQAVLKSVKVMAIPVTAANNYKFNPPGQGVDLSYRYDLDLSSSNGTLQGFAQRFNTNDIFHSASEICDIYLVPFGANPAASYNSMDTWWGNNGQLTGDNTREAPYGQIYARVTTKSNSYLIHVRAEALWQIPAGRGTADWAQWNEGRDQIVGEYRGSSLVERYIDPGDPNLPDFATLPLNDPKGVIDNYYKFRVISTKKL